MDIVNVIVALLTIIASIAAAELNTSSCHQKSSEHQMRRGNTHRFYRGPRRDVVLRGRGYRNATTGSYLTCAGMCLREDACKSFNFCRDDKSCELNSAVYSKNESDLQFSCGCLYFDEEYHEDYNLPTVDGPADCQAVYDAGGNTSGVYTIYPSQYPDGLQVYCDMISHPVAYVDPPLDIRGGWIVFQRRQNGMVNFTRNWAGYRDGFGDLTGEFWLGNEKLRRLTEDGGDRWEMVVEFEEDVGVTCTLYALYEEFNITGDNYTLHVKFNSLHVIHGFYDPDDDSFAQHNHRSFSTYDRDNDGDADTNCADQSKGGWWFDQCDEDYTLNGRYITIGGDNYFGVWGDFSGRIVKSEMKLRIREGSD